MWDFLIVLGIVPGTGFQITFSELTWFFAVLFLSIYTYREYASFRRRVLVSYKLVKTETGSAKRRIKRQRTGKKLLTAYQSSKKKLYAHFKNPKKLRGITAAKLHTKQRLA